MPIKYAEIVAARRVPCPGRRTPWGFFPKGSNVTGYGKRISTEYQVQVYGGSKRWLNVYCCIYSNSGSLYTTAGYVKDWQLQNYLKRKVMR